MPMEVILLERVPKLGQMGEIVRVKPGYARNYLLPKKKALRATKQSLAYFESQRQRLEAINLERRQEAEKVAEQLAGFSVVLVRQASEALHLYGSVTARDVALAAEEAGVTLARNQVLLDHPIKTLGLHKVELVLHPEVIVTIDVNVARSPEEAEFQAKGGVIQVETGRAITDEMAADLAEQTGADETEAEAEEPAPEA